MKPVFAIIVTYKRFEHFKNTVESLLPTLPAGSRLFVVNNDSSDHQTIEYLEQLSTTLPSGVDFDFMTMSMNGGWGASVNAGLARNGGVTITQDWRNYEYVLESNNDVIYEPGWFEKTKELMEAHAEIGIFGLFKHPYHGTRKVLSDGLVIKDDMPATAWVMRSKDLSEFLPFPEHGPCKTRGGNGEDVAFRDKVQNAHGRWICGMETDWAHHMDGYDIPDLGKENPAYL